MLHQPYRLRPWLALKILQVHIPASWIMPGILQITSYIQSFQMIVVNQTTNASNRELLIKMISTLREDSELVQVQHYHQGLRTCVRL